MQSSCFSKALGHSSRSSSREHCFDSSMSRYFLSSILWQHVSTGPRSRRGIGTRSETRSAMLRHPWIQEQVNRSENRHDAGLDREPTAGLRASSIMGTSARCRPGYFTHDGEQIALWLLAIARRESLPKVRFKSFRKTDCMHKEGHRASRWSGPRCGQNHPSCQGIRRTLLLNVIRLKA